MVAAASVVEAFGVTFELTLEQPDQAARVAALLPPGSRPGDSARSGASFVLTAGGDVIQDGEVLIEAAGAVAVDALEGAIRAHVALTAPDHIFIHAGVVVLDGRAVVLPGSSFSGKSRLVAELVRAGATYFSDEFAVLDREGRVHPYPKPLSLRLHGGPFQTEVPPAVLGAETGSGPAPVGSVVITRYSEGARWRPRRLEPSAGAMELLAHAIPARSRPAQSLAAVGRAVAGTTVFETPRGDAADTAALLMHDARV